MPELSFESSVVPENVISPVFALPVAVIVMLPSASLAVDMPVPPKKFTCSPLLTTLPVLSSAPTWKLYAGAPSPPPSSPSASVRSFTSVGIVGVFVSES